MTRLMVLTCLLLGLAGPAAAQFVGDVTAQIQVVPVDVLYLADFDPTEIASAPLLFTITLVNDAQARDLVLRVAFTAGRYGYLGTALKRLRGVAPDATLLLTNRDFDEYQIADAAESLLDLAARTGVLPPDTYTYALTVTDTRGQVIATSDGENETSNAPALQLVAPGTAFGDVPELLDGRTPLFQWFGGAPSAVFSLALYEVQPGQNSPDAVVDGRPVFAAGDLSATTFLYPNYAETLAPGRTYAWQVTTVLTSGQGQQHLASEVYWFTTAAAEDAPGGGPGGSPGGGTTSVAVMPDFVEVAGGEGFLFQALGSDADGRPIAAVPTWRVVPAGAGRIDAGGYFVAAMRPGVAAVVADYGGVQAFATVVVRWDVRRWSMRQAFDQLFGLPGGN